MKNAIIIFALAFITLAVFLPSYSQMQDLKERNLSLENQIAELELKKKNLEEEQEKLINDPVYLEKVAREKMGIVKEGEVVYRIGDIEEKQ